MSTLPRADLPPIPGVPGSVGASRKRREWMPAAMLWLVTAVLIVARQGTVLTLAFPVLAIATGLWLYF
jgi:hypothetical protein